MPTLFNCCLAAQAPPRVHRQVFAKPPSSSSDKLHVTFLKIGAFLDKNKGKLAIFLIISGLLLLPVTGGGSVIALISGFALVVPASVGIGIGSGLCGAGFILLLKARLDRSGRSQQLSIIVDRKPVKQLKGLASDNAIDQNHGGKSKPLWRDQSKGIDQNRLEHDAREEVTVDLNNSDQQVADWFSTNLVKSKQQALSALEEIPALEDNDNFTKQIASEQDVNESPHKSRAPQNSIFVRLLTPPPSELFINEAASVTDITEIFDQDPPEEDGLDASSPHTHPALHELDHDSNNEDTNDNSDSDDTDDSEEMYQFNLKLHYLYNGRFYKPTSRLTISKPDHPHFFLDRSQLAGEEEINTPNSIELNQRENLDRDEPHSPMVWLGTPSRTRSSPVDQEPLRRVPEDSDDDGLFEV